jgi:phosphoribosylanthranilate isomerase
MQAYSASLGFIHSCNSPRKVEMKERGSQLHGTEASCIICQLTMDKLRLCIQFSMQEDAKRFN